MESCFFFFFFHLKTNFGTILSVKTSGADGKSPSEVNCCVCEHMHRSSCHCSSVKYVMGYVTGFEKKRKKSVSVCAGCEIRVTRHLFLAGSKIRVIQSLVLAGSEKRVTKCWFEAGSEIRVTKCQFVTGCSIRVTKCQFLAGSEIKGQSVGLWLALK